MQKPTFPCTPFLTCQRAREKDAQLFLWLFLPTHLTLVMLARLAGHRFALATLLMVLLANAADGLACKPHLPSYMQAPVTVFAIPTGSPAGSPPCRAAPPLALGSPNPCSGQPQPLLQAALALAAPALRSAAGCTALAPSSPGAATALPSPLPQTVLGSLTN